MTAASYETVKYDTAEAAKLVLPSYQFGVDVNGAAEGGFTTLVYEPYLNGDVKRTWTSWDAFTGRWWSTKKINGQDTRDVLKRLPEIVVDNPAAVVLYYGVNVGAGNAGADVAFDSVSFGTAIGSCTEHQWTSHRHADRRCDHDRPAGAQHRRTVNDARCRAAGHRRTDRTAHRSRRRHDHRGHCAAPGVAPPAASDSPPDLTSEQIRPQALLPERKARAGLRPTGRTINSQRHVSCFL